MTYWPTEDGWPYADAEARLDLRELDPSAEVDDDVLSLATESHLLDSLDPLERQVILGHYGLDGAEPRSLKELRSELGVPRTDLRTALGTGLAKLRTHLSDG